MSEINSIHGKKMNISELYNKCTWKMEMDWCNEFLFLAHPDIDKVFFGEGEGIVNSCKSYKLA